MRSFPYGDTYHAAACGPDVLIGDGATSESGEPLVPHLRPVANLATCEGGFPGLFDLLGNVAEFQYGCITGEHDSGTNCIVGGARSNVVNPQDPPVVETDALAWGDTSAGVGFRCCADTIDSTK